MTAEARAEFDLTLVETPDDREQRETKQSNAALLAMMGGLS